MKRYSLLMVALVLIFALGSSAYGDWYVANGNTSAKKVDIYNPDLTLHTSIDTTAVAGSIWSVDFASNGDLYFVAAYNQEVFKSIYLGSGDWAAPASYGFIPSGYAFNLAARADGTVYIGTYDSDTIFKMTPTSVTTIVSLSGGYAWYDMELAPEGVPGDFFVSRQLNYTKNYNDDGSEAGSHFKGVKFTGSSGDFYVYQNASHRGITFGPGNALYVTDAIYNSGVTKVDPATGDVLEDQYILDYVRLNRDGVPGKDQYPQTMEFGPDYDGDGHGDFYIKRMTLQDTFGKMLVYSGAPGLANDSRYLGELLIDDTNWCAISTWGDPIPEPGSLLALASGAGWVGSLVCAAVRRRRR